jgi:hypothetical protein
MAASVTVHAWRGPDDVSLVILLIACSRRRFSALHNASIGTQIPRVSLEIPRFPFRSMIKIRKHRSSSTLVIIRSWIAHPELYLPYCLYKNK